MEFHPALKSFRSSRQAAFTLMELLIVVAIVMILMALMIPGFVSVREFSRSSACLSNLKQLTTACLSYSADNDGVLIPIAKGTSSADAKAWRVLILPYVGTNSAVFKCSSDAMGMKETYNAQGLSPCSYGLNYNKVMVGTALASQLHEYLGINPGRRFTSVLRPASTIMLCDIGIVKNPTVAVKNWIENTSQHDRLGNRNGLGYARFPTDPQFTGGDAWNIFPRHWKKKANVAFYDGHIASVDVQADILNHPPSDGSCLYSNE